MPLRFAAFALACTLAPAGVCGMRGVDEEAAFLQLKDPKEAKSQAQPEEAAAAARPAGNMTLDVDETLGSEATALHRTVFAALGEALQGVGASSKVAAEADGNADEAEAEENAEEGARQAKKVTRRTPSGQRVAVLTSGSLKRYFLTEAAQGLVAPLVKEGYAVDYYAALTVAEFSAWNANADSYVPEFRPEGSKLPEVKAIVEQKIEDAGGHARTVELIENVTLSARDNQFINEGTWNGLGPGLHARQNVVSMLKPLQALGQKMEHVEAKDGKYDYVVLVKDDAIWMKPFSLQTLLTQPVESSNPDGYVLRCDEGISTYSPPSATEITEYIFVLKRSASTPFYMMHKVLMDGGLAASGSKETLQKYWDAVNLETFAKILADDFNVRLQRTPPYLLPMQRGGRLEVDGEVKTCLHKCCDSSVNGLPFLEPRKQLPACDGPLEPHLRSGSS